jgi:hypothetical protein
MNADGDVDPLARSRDIPRIIAAINEGVRAALLDHKRTGNPIAVWRDGQVVWIPPEEIPVDEHDIG